MREDRLLTLFSAWDGAGAQPMPAPVQARACPASEAGTRLLLAPSRFLSDTVRSLKSARGARPSPSP